MPGGGAARSRGAEVDAVVDAVTRRVDHMVELRRTLHRHPELSFEETETSNLVRSDLAAVGLPVLPCPTPTGAVAILDGGRSGATVLLRADIDGLPVQERTGLPFASEVDGRMHACGHDAHTAIMLGVAGALADRAEDLPGRYFFVFQPAEERVSGAQAMVDGGLLDEIHPEAAIGLHVVSSAPTGTIEGRPDIAMAGGWGLQLVVTGSGGHGAMQPRQGNVVLAVARLADRLHTAVDGMALGPVDYVCSPGMIVAGSAPNVVPTRAELAATLRWFDPSLRDEAMRRLETMATDVSREFDVAVTIERAFGTGPVRNDPAVTELVLDTAARTLPEVQVSRMQLPIPASDDVSVILDRVPGCYLFVGAALADGTSGAHHSPTFAIDEDAIRIGATALAASAVRLAATRTGDRAGRP